MYLAEATWPAVEALETDLALLPVGSTEQHGPHAPLGTDFRAAEAVATAGRDAFEGEVLVAPTIPVGVAAEHRSFAGTLWVAEDTFRAYVRETIESLAAHGFTRVVVVNGHGGNVAPLRECCARFTRNRSLAANPDAVGYAVPFTWFDAVDADTVTELAGVNLGHGGPVETSLVWHLDPDLVQPDEFERAHVDGTDTWGEWAAGVNLAYDSAEFTDSGAIGDPGEASPELGAALLEGAGEALATLLDAVADRDLGRN